MAVTFFIHKRFLMPILVPELSNYEVNHVENQEKSPILDMVNNLIAQEPRYIYQKSLHHIFGQVSKEPKGRYCTLSFI